MSRQLPQTSQSEVEKCIEWAKKFVSSLHGRVPPASDPDDLFGAALLGLAESINRYDPDKKASLKTFAKKRMVGAVKDELRRYDPLTRGQRKRFRDLLEKEEHEVEEKDDTLDKEETEEMQSLRLVCNHGRRLPLEEFEADSSQTTTLSDHTNSPEESCHRKRICSIIKNNIDKLNLRARNILELLYFQDLSTIEVGEKLGLSQSRISQIRYESLTQLRENMMPVMQRAA